MNETTRLQPLFEGRFVLRNVAVMFVAVMVWIAVPVPTLGAEEVDYAREIKPILAEYCYRCHGPEKQTSGLRFDRKVEALAGGDSGAAITPGKPAKSPLLDRIASVDAESMMPP